MSIPILIILLIANLAMPIILPNSRFNWMSYMASGMLIAAILKVMKG